MSFHNLSWNTSTLGSEECLEGIALLDRRPFLCQEEEESGELIEPLSHDDPFTEHPKPAAKHNEIIFISRRRKHAAQNWSERLRLVGTADNCIRSAPQAAQQLDADSHRNGEVCTLPTVGHGRSDAILRISADTAAALIREDIKRDCMFIDARFGYEYAGGHVRGAVNISDEQSIDQLLGSRKVLIFYCEFSSVRGPTLARRLRNADRRRNEYPRLSCPEIYVLEGGYSKFHCEHPGLCSPSAYVRMHDKRYADECAQEYRKKRYRKK